MKKIISIIVLSCLTILIAQAQPNTMPAIRKVGQRPKGEEVTKPAQIQAIQVNGHTEVFSIRYNGSVYSSYNPITKQYQEVEIAPAGSACSGSKIAAVSRKLDTREIFWVAPNGSIQDAFYYDGDTQWRRFELMPSNSAACNSSIKAISRKPETIEIFWVGNDESIMDAYWYEGQKGWNSYVLAPPSSGINTAGSTLTALSRQSNHLEVFWITRNGKIDAAYWYEGQPKFIPFNIAPKGTASFYGSITSLSRKANTMELFWFGAENSIYNASWYEGKNWTIYLPVTKENTDVDLSKPNSTGLTVCNLNPTSIQLFWATRNGAIKIANWQDGNPAGVYDVGNVAPIYTSFLGSNVLATSQPSIKVDIYYGGANKTMSNQVTINNLPITAIQIKNFKSNFIDPNVAVNNLPLPVINELKNVVETQNGITYNLFYNTSSAPMYRKGILVMGSGQKNGDIPEIGDAYDPQCVDLCKQAAQNGYVAAVISYTKGTSGNYGSPTIWNNNANQLAVDFDKCITAISSKYEIDKSKTVVGGYSYSSYMLLTNNALGNELTYCKGLLAACGATDDYKISQLKYPVYAITCSGSGYSHTTGGKSGDILYNQMSPGAIKDKSGGYTDNSCSTHCGGNYTQKLYQQLVVWLQ